MSAWKRGLLLLLIAIIVQSLVGFVFRPLIFDIGTAAMIGWGVSGLIAAAIFGFVTGWHHVYAMTPRSLWAFVIDISWSAINTLSGLGFLFYCALVGTFRQPSTISRERGIIQFSDAALGGADATTIGTVMGGKWYIHEAVHVQQARILGPFYWPTYLVNYALSMLVRFLTIRFKDPHWEAYGRVLLEDWAYRAAPGEKVLVGPTILWCGITLINTLALAVMVAPIPVIGAIPRLFGLNAIPWWSGLIVLVLYALVRSFFRAADEEESHVAATTKSSELVFR